MMPSVGFHLAPAPPQIKEGVDDRILGDGDEDIEAIHELADDDLPFLETVPVFVVFPYREPLAAVERRLHEPFAENQTFHLCHKSFRMQLLTK